MLTNCIGSDFTLSLIVSVKGVKHVGCEKRVIFLDHACRKCFICCRNLWACLHFHLPLQKQNCCLRIGAIHTQPVAKCAFNPTLWRQRWVQPVPGQPRLHSKTLSRNKNQSLNWEYEHIILTASWLRTAKVGNLNPDKRQFPCHCS